MNTFASLLYGWLIVARHTASGCSASKGMNLYRSKKTRMSLNLITDPWLPAIHDGQQVALRPDQIAEEGIVRPDWPRADLNPGSTNRPVMPTPQAAAGVLSMSVNRPLRTKPPCSPRQMV